MRKYLVFLWLVAGLVPIAWAQEETSAKSEGAGDPFFETVDVNVVNVEVFVTDKKGSPVGLTADDFEIVEDKRPVALTNFYEVKEGRRIRPQPSTKQAGSEVPAEAPAAVADEEALPEDQRLFLIVYVDNFNIRPFNRNRVFRRLREFLHDRVETADQVMLVSYDRSLNVRHPFTSDSSAISRALFDLEELSGHAVSQDSDRREVLRAIDEAGDVLEVEWRVCGNTPRRSITICRSLSMRCGILSDRLPVWRGARPSSTSVMGWR